MVGAFNTAFYFAVFNLLLHADLHPIVANSSAFLVTNVIAFFLQKHFAFRDKRRHAMFLQYARFLALTLIGLGIQTAAFSLFRIPFHRYGTLGNNLAAVCATPFAVLWNFTAYRLWTFKPATATA